MKINWFSPLPPDRTDIANFSRRLLPALAKQAEVTVWTSTHAWDRSIEEIAPIRSCDLLKHDWKDLNFADFSIFNIGNNARFHGRIADVMERHHGVVILHDTNVHELIRSRLIDQGNRIDTYLALLGATGGDEAVSMGHRHLEGSLPVDEIARAYPFSDVVLKGCHGVMIHNPLEFDSIRGSTRAPLRCSRLPYDLAQGSPRPREMESGRPLRMVMFGFLHGTNRRLRPVLEALASFPQRDRMQLDLFGEVNDKTAIETALAELGLQSLVHWHGFLDDTQMDDVLGRADLAINLRYPTRGEASGSQLRIWEHALPSCVTRSGYYATLPDDTVAFINPDDEARDLHRCWKAMLENPDRYYEMGRKGFAYLQKNHSPEAWVRELMLLLDEAHAYRGTSMAEATAARFARQFVDPLNHPVAQKHYLTRMSSELARWFSPLQNDHSASEA